MRSQLFLLTMLGSLSVACGRDDAEAREVPWEEDTLVLRSADGTTQEVTLSGGCGDLGADACEAISDECGSRDAADVFVDENGEVLEVICLPAAGETNDVIYTSTEDSPPEFTNNDIIVLEGTPDSPAIVGDLTLDSNNVVIYGEDPETSILDGNLDITKNNAVVAGITITGDVVITFNNATLTNCIIEGDLTLEGNNARIAGCTIFGDVTIVGNNNVITSTEIRGTFTDEGENSCVESESSGEELACD